MAIPTFNTFSFNDSNFITERITFKGYSDRAVVRSKVNRREGIKLLATEFGEKQVTLDGVVVASSPSNLQSLLDGLKKALTSEEGSLVLETGRTFRATVANIQIPDEHYNQSKTDFQVTFICSDPFSTGALQTVVQTLTSGFANLSGYINISGTLFARPTLVLTPTTKVGNTNIRSIRIMHVPTGQAVTISGFGSGTNLSYNTPVTINFDNFTSLEGSTIKSNAGSFARWEPGDNNYIITVSGNWVGGSISVSYAPRYL